MMYNACNPMREINNNRTNESNNNQINEIINNAKYKINNKGWISIIKPESVYRLFVINPRGFGPDSHDKIEQMRRTTISEEIDM